MKRIRFALLGLFLGFLAASCSKESSVAFSAMNTVMHITSYGKKSEKANAVCKKRIEELEKILSTTMDDSDIFKLNNAKGKPCSVHPETAFLLDFTLNFAKKTGNAFNPALYPVTRSWGFTTGSYRVPSAEEIEKLLALTDIRNVLVDGDTVSLSCGSMLDLGAAGKGFAGDEAVKLLKEKGIKSAILDLGGNVQALGCKPNGKPWTIGLRSPEDDGVPVALKVCDCAVVTSGGYERFFTAEDGRTFVHILDGRTGIPVENELVSATIVAESGLYADVLSTTVFVLGKEAATELWRGSHDFEMILLLEDGSLAYTEGLSDKISVLSDFSKIEIIR